MPVRSKGTPGMLIGALITLLISQNYHCIINCYPEAGGAFSYIKSIFRYDQGFLVFWFLALAYFAMPHSFRCLSGTLSVMCS